MCPISFVCLLWYNNSTHNYSEEGDDAYPNKTESIELLERDHDDDDNSNVDQHHDSHQDESSRTEQNSTTSTDDKHKQIDYLHNFLHMLGQWTRKIKNTKTWHAIRRKHPEKIIPTILLFILFVMLAFVLGTYLYYQNSTVAFPVSGTWKIDGLRADVSVERESNGLIHIFAKYDQDLCFAQGLVWIAI